MAIPKKALVGLKGECTRQEKLVASKEKKIRDKGIQERGKGGFQLAKRKAVLQRQKDQVKAARK